MNHAREVGERKELFIKHFPDATTGFPYTRKVILAFLDLGGVDYLFYGYIIHEYGADCPAPNTKVGWRCDERCRELVLRKAGDGCYCDGLGSLWFPPVFRQLPQFLTFP